MKYKYIPYGTRCTSAEVIFDLGLRFGSLPFDWIDSPMSGIKSFFPGTRERTEEFVRNYFSEVQQQRHPNDNTWFPHDFVTNTPEEREDIIQKYIRRFYRLFDYLQQGDHEIVLLSTIAIVGDESHSRGYDNAVQWIRACTNKKVHAVVVNLISRDYCSSDNDFGLHIPFRNDWTVFRTEVAERLLSNPLTEHLFKK